MMRSWKGIIDGKPVSMKNRRIVGRSRAGRTFSRKSTEAQVWQDSIKVQAKKQAPAEMLEGPVSFTVVAYYPNRRADLDVALLFDALEGIVYGNDRQIWEIHVHRRLDKDNPRCACIVREIEEPT